VRDSFFYRRLALPVLDLLRQGVTPEKLALSLALGAVIGVFPGLGCSTTMCALVAVFWRLNLPAIQILNYFMYPVQIALIIPFFRLGERLFHAPHLPLSVSQISAMVRGDFWGTSKFLWTTLWHAMVVWAIFAPFFVGLIYFLLVPAFGRILRRLSTPLPSEEV
jgi:uncharacterized protein (DUF2062 family)